MSDDYITHYDGFGEKTKVLKTDLVARVERLVDGWDTGPTPDLDEVDADSVFWCLKGDLKASPERAYEIVSRSLNPLSLEDRLRLPNGLLEYAGREHQQKLGYLPLRQIGYAEPPAGFTIKDEETGKDRTPTQVEWEDLLYAHDAPRRQEAVRELLEEDAKFQAAYEENTRKINAIRAKPGYQDTVNRLSSGVYVGETGTFGGGAVSKQKYESVTTGTGITL